MNRKTPLIAISSLAIAALVAGCSLPVLQVDAQSGLQSGAMSGLSGQSGSQSGASNDLALTDAQVERIVAEIQDVLSKSDKDQSADPLSQRVVNPALDLRKGQLVRAKKLGDPQAPLVLGHAVHSVTAGSSFPRVLVVASEPVEDNPAEVFFLTQKDAKSEYMLQNWVRLTGGTPVKGVAIKTGSKTITGNDTGQKMTPNEVISAYVNHLNSPDNTEYQVFDDKIVIPRMNQELAAVQEAAAVAGTVTNEASTVDTPSIGVSLDTGEALVASSFKYVQRYSRTVEGSTLTLSGTPAAYLDDPNVNTTVDVEYQVNIFFLVPAKGSKDPISVVGAERVIQSVNKAA